MIGNLFSLLVLVALIVLFGWLAKRAWGANRWFIKFPGVILAGLLALVILLVVFVAGKGLAILYFPGSEPVPNLKVEGTSEQIARGKYIAYIGCAGCHGDKGEFPLIGGTDFAGEVPLPIGSMMVPNLTQGGVLKDRTDGELFRVLRHGIAKDGTMAVMMAQLPYRQLSEDDTKALIAFLRSQAPVETKVKSGDDLNLLGAILFGAGMFPAPDPINKNSITAPAKGMNAEYGKYVATFGECRGCHGPTMTGSPPNPAQPEGVPNPRPLVGTWTREQFIQTMRTGTKPTGQKFPEQMPWVNASRMNDEDLSALYEYLKAKP